MHVFQTFWGQILRRAHAQIARFVIKERGAEINQFYAGDFASVIRDKNIVWLKIGVDDVAVLEHIEGFKKFA